MADQKLELNKVTKSSEPTEVTFYVTRPDGQIPASGPTILWPFGSGLTDWHTANDRNQRQVDVQKNIRFENGYFVTSNPDQIWLLDHYNSGGTFIDAKRDINVNYPGDRYLCMISRKDPNAVEVKVVTEKTVETVEVTRYPREVLEAMTPDVLINICGIMQIDISNVDKTTMAIVNAMDDKWYVTK